jgi:hypothetical protein
MDVMSAGPMCPLFPSVLPEAFELVDLEAKMRGALDVIDRLRLAPIPVRDPRRGPGLHQERSPLRWEPPQVATRYDAVLEMLRSEHRKVLRDLIEELAETPSEPAAR